MSSLKKKMTVVLHPEWEPMLERLKEDSRFGDTRADVLCTLIKRGLEISESVKVVSDPHPTTDTPIQSE